MNKKNILKISIIAIIILIIIFSVFVFKKDNQKIENDTKNQKQEKIVENKTTKIEKENKENKENKQKVLLKNIEFNNEKISLLQTKQKEKNDSLETKIIKIKKNKNGSETVLEKLLPAGYNEINIHNIFLFHSDYSNQDYIVLITKWDSAGADAGQAYGMFYEIFLYDDNYKNINRNDNYIESGFDGETNMGFFDFKYKNKKPLISKLRELEKEGKL